MIIIKGIILSLKIQISKPELSKNDTLLVLTSALC